MSDLGRKEVVLTEERIWSAISIFRALMKTLDIPYSVEKISTQSIFGIIETFGKNWTTMSFMVFIFYLLRTTFCYKKIPSK